MTFVFTWSGSCRFMTTSSQQMILLCVAILFFTLNAAEGRASLLVFTTSDNTFDAGVKNQGWWSAPLVTPPGGETFDTNDNYFVGSNGTFVHRNFFTFYLDATDLAGQLITSVTLELSKGGWNQVGGATTKPITFYDVSTDAATLNSNNGTNQVIFDDLGMGTTYGTFNVSTIPGPITTLLTFSLNNSAVADMQASVGGYFSIGGSLEGVADPDVNFGFSSTAVSSLPNGIQRLIVQTVPLSAVPEPSAYIVWGIIGLTIGGGYWWRRTRA